ncbi:type VI secretion system tip protein TssI/VgrG [Sorangium sp. So ce429]
MESLPAWMRVVRLEGREAISELFHVEITLAAEDESLALGDVVGQPALLTLNGPATPRLVHGVIARFEQAEEGKRFTLYRATLVPAAWLLQHRHDCRIFQELTVPEIITKVLEAAGLHADLYRFLIHGDHPVREYCVQYRESDWAFISRLMEEEGIFCFFEHHPDRHVLVMSDSLHAHAPIAGGEELPFRPGLGALASREHVSRFRCAQQVQPGQITLRDFNFKTPSLSLEAKATAAQGGQLEIYDYPGAYGTPEAGKGLSRIRLEGWQAAVRTAHGESGCVRLTPGYVFALEEHPREAFNGRYLLLSVEHRGSQPLLGEAADGEEPHYENSIHCMPAEVPYRPPRWTPRPTVHGVQTAIVVGPAGEEIYTDAHGRVKVQFHWDRQGRRDDRSSCWIRVSQLMAGQGWGAMYIPRIGHEVLVDFLEGDPDRPIITGRVYHQTNPPPYPLPAERTKSTIKTNTSPGGGGSNELRFEDKKGQEEIYLHGQKDWNIVVEHDKSQRVGHDEALQVTHNRTKAVGVDQSETIGVNKTIQVGKDHTELIGGNETKVIGGSRSQAVALSQSELVGVNKSIEVGAHHTETIGATMTVTVGAAKAETVGLASAETVGAGKALSIGGMYAVAVGADMRTEVAGSSAESAGGSKAVSAGETISIVCGSSKLSMDKGGNVIIEASNMKIDASGTVKVVASGKVDVESSGTVNLNATGNVKVKGSLVGIN